MTLPKLEIEVTADTKAADRNLKQLGGSVDNVGDKAVTAKAKAGGLSGGLSKLGNVSNRTRSQIQNASFQIQDIIVQLQSGTKASTALAQQLPQLAGGFGAVGAAIGVGVGLGIPALSIAFQSLTKESKTLEESLEELSDAVSEYRDMAGQANQTTSELAERFGSLSSEAKQIAGFLAEWNRIDAIDKLNASVSILSESFGGFDDQMTAMSARMGTELSKTVERVANRFDLSRDSANALTDSLRRMSEARGIDAQVDSAIALNRELIAIFGSIDKIPPELQEMARQSSIIALKASEIKGGIDEATVATFNLLDAANGIPNILDMAADSASNMASQLWDAAGAAMELAKARDAAIMGGPDAARFGVMGSLTPSGLSRDDIVSTLSVGGGGSRGGGRSGGGGGGGGGSGGGNNISALIESLQTESEIIDTWYADSLDKLNNANAAELEVLGGHNEARLRLEQEYQERLSQMRTGYNGDTLTQAGTFFGEMATALSSGNDKLLGISEKFAKAEAIVNSIRAYSQVAADPTLPWFAKIPAALSIAGAVSSAASSLKGGGGSGATTPGASSGGASQRDTLTVSLSGVDPSALYSGSQVTGLTDAILSELGDRNLNIVYNQ